MAEMRSRVRVAIAGAVQGVGFRPFVFRLAAELGLAGWVSNSAQGVLIEAQATRPILEVFLARLEAEKPALAVIQSLDCQWLAPNGDTAFEIRHSDGSGSKTALMLPDIATCPDCLRELFDPNDRRFGYPFINCTHCGPRFSIIEALPYDRPNTTMKHFPMCDRCRAEYENPLDRRFHAQPNACPDCGPQLELWAADGRILASRYDALLTAAQTIRDGAVVALKGLGGFHLVADARSETAVRELRCRKRRPDKPLAVMMPSAQHVRECCYASALEADLLRSAEAPITLLRRRKAAEEMLAASLAPGNPYLGVMLPYTPLHHLLLAELGFPVVATSGNRSDEPICTDEQEALERLAGIADVFLTHNRPIVRHVDDSIVRIVGGREMVLRRARGYAPLPLRVERPLPPWLAVGGHMKNTVALAVERDIFVSQHIGDLETVQAFKAFEAVIASFEQAYDVQPTTLIGDVHPDYRSTQFAESTGLPVIRIQHHEAHIRAVMAEHSLDAPALGVSWDGTGYGQDGTIWGGEFLLLTGSGCARFAHLRPFRLPGGDRAVVEPRRAAIGVLYELMGAGAFEQDTLPPLAEFSQQELKLLRAMLQQGLNAPLTTSAGRLFDAAAALIGLCQQATFEGQAAMALEFALAEAAPTRAVYRFEVTGAGAPFVLDWRLLVGDLLTDVWRCVPVGDMAAKFHNTLVEMVVRVAERAGCEQVALSGGCFQNVYLVERAIERLREAGFAPYWPGRFPPNDGGLALGQIIAAAQRMK